MFETSFVRAQVWDGVVTKMGMSDKLRFWFDVWCVPVSLASNFSGLYLLSAQKMYIIQQMGS